MSRLSRLSAMHARQERHNDVVRRDEAIRAGYGHEPTWVLAARSGWSENFVQRIGARRT